MFLLLTLNMYLPVGVIILVDITYFEIMYEKNYQSHSWSSRIGILWEFAAENLNLYGTIKKDVQIFQQKKHFFLKICKFNKS